MIATNVRKDMDALTMTVTAELDATVERAWQLWADPRQLERWWGPPTYPATFVDHELSPGARVTYYMTSPEGEKFYGWWQVVDVEAPTRLEVLDGFGDETGAPNESMPTGEMVITLAERDGGGTLMTICSTHSSLEAMQQVLDMGQEEGMLAAMSQIPEILAETA